MKGELFSKKINVGKRTYFFNVKENRHGDVFLNIVESKKLLDGEFERRSVIVFYEDLDKFTECLDEMIDFIRDKHKED